MPSTLLVPGPAAPAAVTMRTSCPRATKRRANSYDRVPPTPARVTKNWCRYRIRITPMPNASRALDVAVAAIVLAITSPLLAVAALAIRLESRGPVFYRQRRGGRQREPLELWEARPVVPQGG